jgi:hypothetical protein
VLPMAARIWTSAMLNAPLTSSARVRALCSKAQSGHRLFSSVLGTSQRQSSQIVDISVCSIALPIRFDFASV